MSEREKRLLFVLITAVFVVVNFGAFKLLYQSRYIDAQSRLTAAEAQLAEGQLLVETRDQFEDEIVWVSCTVAGSG